MSAVRRLVGLTVITGFALSGCGGPEVEGPGPMESTPVASLASRSPCSSVAYPTLQTTRMTIPVGACVSFGRYSDITAVITGLDVADKALFGAVDQLTYRAALVGSTVFSIHTKREICTATATCQVMNPVKELTVRVTSAP